MSIVHDWRWSAYMDGELEEQEQEAFLASLTPEQRQQLEREAELEDGMMAFLADGPPCPDHAWEKAKRLIWESEAVRTRARFRKVRRIAAVVAPLAAVLLIVFAALIPGFFQDTPPFLKVAAADVRELQEQSEVDPDTERIAQFMRQHGINLSLRQPPEAVRTSPMPLDLLGATHVEYKGEPVVCVLYSCCGNPAKVVVAVQGGKAERVMQRAWKRGELLLLRPIGLHHIGAVVGQTFRDELLLDLLEPSEEMPPGLCLLPPHLDSRQAQSQ